MLESLSLTDWKSFGSNANVLAFGPLTLLVGPNGSGKSNALDALRFLQGAALDFPLGDVLRGRWEGQREIWPAIRGQVVEAARAGTSRFELTARWRVEDGDELTHSLAVETAPEVVLAQESLKRQGSRSASFDTHAPALRSAAGRQPGGSIKAAVRGKGQGNSPTNSYSAARSLLGQVFTAERAHADALEDARTAQSALRNIVFLDIQPSRMRDYRPEHAPALGTSGENISPTLHALPRDRLADVVDWVSELCAPRLSGLSFDTTQLKEVMFFLREGEHTISARSVSDGTLRFLGLVTALLTAAPGSLMVLEEPDVGLHPARVHLLARLLEQATAAGRIQVVATTHSPTLLAHLNASSLSNVLALGRDRDGLSVARRLGELPHFPTLRDSKQLEHLVSTGWIERAL